MAGYYGFSKSNNAVEAERSGLMVASKLAACAAKAWPRLRGLKAADVEEVVRPVEWHHTSKMYNCVNYYAFESLFERGVRGRLYRLVLARRAAKAAKPVTLTGCTVKWLEWGGTRAKPKATERVAHFCEVTFTPGSDQVRVVAPPQSCTKFEGKVFERGAANFKKFLSTRGFHVISAAGEEIWRNPCTPSPWEVAHAK
jgi:hypothetical protein